MTAQFGYQSRALAGQALCGDVGAWWDGSQRRVLALADGLGHGAAAHRAASLAMQCIEAHLHDSCEAIFAACNDALLDTRGAVLAVAVIDLDSNMLTLGTMGNIRTCLLGADGETWMATSRGFVGAGYPLPPTQQMVLCAGDMLVMLSDGIDAAENLHLGLAGAGGTSQQLADDVVGANARASDDAAVLAYRHDKKKEAQ